MIRREAEEVDAKPTTILWADEYKARVQAYIERWAAVLFLDRHHINITFSESDKANGNKCAADIRDNHPYESGHHVTFYPEYLKMTDESLADRAVLHELVHIPVALLKELLSKIIVSEKFVTWREVEAADERAVDWLANVIFELKGK